MALAALSQNPAALKFLDPTLQNDRDLVLTATAAFSDAALPFAAPELQRNLRNEIAVSAGLIIGSTSKF